MAELGPIVRPDVLRWPVLDEQVGQALQHIVRPKSSRHLDGEAAPRELVKYARHAERRGLFVEWAVRYSEHRPRIPSIVLDESLPWAQSRHVQCTSKSRNVTQTSIPVAGYQREGAAVQYHAA